MIHRAIVRIDGLPGHGKTTLIERIRETRIPITALAADLVDPRDPGTRKAVRRVVRDLKRGG